MVNKSKGPAGRRRSSVNNNIRINSSLTDRRKAKKHSKAAAKAEYLSTLPKEPWKRLLYRLQPKRVANYWFSREGGIMALKLIGVGIVVCFFLTVGLFAYFRKDLPKIKDISGGNLGGSITYYDRSGQTVLWQDYDAVKRIPVPDEQISDYLKEATIAIENKDFYNQGAFDVRGIARAAYNDVFNRSAGLQGGSTITQQLVKLNEDWTNDRTISRKVKELILAVELEREYSKKEILTGYLNMAPYGGVEYGAEAASRNYFQTDAKNLTLAQAAMLAAIPKSPSRLSPYSSTQFNPSASNKFDREGLLGRQQYILKLMAEQGYVTADEADAAKKVDVLAQIKPRTSKYDDIKAPYFVLAAKQELQEKFGATNVARGGWRVVTSLNLELQKSAEDLTAKNIANVRRNGGDTSAIVATDVKTGQMVALVGGPDFNNEEFGKLNYAQLNISPGSSFKPYDYATFIENRTDAGASSVFYDSQGPLPGYPCTVKTRKTATDKSGNCLFDYDFNYPGAVTMRYALGGSRNLPAVKAMLSAVPNDKSQDRTKSINKVITTANSMMGNSNAYKCFKSGVDVQNATKSDQKQCFGSSAIGDGAYLHLDEHVNGLGTMARLGQSLPQTYILEVKDAGNKDLYKWTQPKPKQVMRPDSAYIVNDMMSDAKASYMRPQYKMHDYNGWKTAIKTGTTNDNYDGLMVAWNTQYAVASWVGYHTRTKTLRGSMESMTAPLTQSFMKDALNKLNTKPVNWEKPTGVKLVNGYVQRSHVGLSSVEPGPVQDLFPAWYQPKAGAKSASATIDRVSGGIATNCTPAAAKQRVGGANDNTFSVDEFYPVGRAATSSSTDATAASNDTLHKCDDAKPTVTVNAPATCSDVDNGGQGCLVTAVVTAGTHPLSGRSFGGNAVMTVNGAQAGTQNLGESPSTVSFYYKPTAAGSVNVTVTATDSVLYDGSQTVLVNTTVGPTARTNRGNTATLANVTRNQRGNTSTGGTDENRTETRRLNKLRNNRN